MRRFLSFPAFYVTAIVLGGALLVYAFSTFRVEGVEEEDTDNQLAVLGASEMKFVPPSSVPIVSTQNSNLPTFGPQAPSPTPIPSPSPTPEPTETPDPTPTSTPTPTPVPTSNSNNNTQASIKIDSIDPDHASIGALVTVKGSGFGSNKGLVIFYNSDNNPKGAIVVDWKENQVQAKVPDVNGNQTYQVEVQKPDAAKSNKRDFRVEKGMPVIESISPPNSQTSGQEIIIQGKDFGSQGSVSFIKDGTTTNASSINSWGESEIKVVIPTKLLGGSYVVQITTNENRQDQYDYIINP